MCRARGIHIEAEVCQPSVVVVDAGHHRGVLQVAAETGVLQAGGAVGAVVGGQCHATAEGPGHSSE